MGERSGRWLRVSTGKQDEGLQVPQVTEWEESHGYEVKAEYVIRGASAFKGNKKFDEMWAQVLKDIRNGEITVLVVWKTDRIDRKLQTYQMIKEVVEAGGRVEFVTQPHLNDLSTMSGRVALNIQQEIAHEESKVKSDRAHMTKNSIRANGYMTSRQPFGYAIEGEWHHKRFIIVEALRATVAMIFKMCIAGDSLITIAKHLDAEGIKTARGGKWSNTAINGMIKNTAYMGYVTDDNGKVIGQCEPIIDADDFKRANDALKNRPKRGAILAENRALCACILFCPECNQDSPMYRIKAGSKSGGQSYYYRCAGKGAQRKGCGNMIPLDAMDTLIDDVVSNHHREILKRVFVPGHNHDAQVADVNFRIKQLDPEAMSDEEYDSALAALRAERDGYKTMPAVADDWKMEPTGETYASKWARLATDMDRNDWLRSEGTKIWARKQDGVRLSVVPDTAGSILNVSPRDSKVQLSIWFGGLNP